MAVGTYGVRVFPYGIEVRTDGRRPGWQRWPGWLKKRGEEWVHVRPRGRIRAYSPASAKRLAMLVANCGVEFRRFITLTYHGVPRTGETVAKRNRRLVDGSKRDLHRFLVVMQRELGQFVWVQEFQQRGAVHFHMLCVGEVAAERVTEAWLRAIGSLGDHAAHLHGVKCEVIRDQRQVRKYLGQYLVGKRREASGFQRRKRKKSKTVQKELPLGVPVAGRWWGASRSLKPIVLAELVTHDKAEGVRRPGELQVARCVRRYLRRRLGRRFDSGSLLDWGGELARGVATMLPELQRFFGSTPSLEEMVARAEAQWERVEGVDSDGLWEEAAGSGRRVECGARVEVGGACEEGVEGGVRSEGEGRTGKQLLLDVEGRGAAIPEASENDRSLAQEARTPFQEIRS